MLEAVLASASQVPPPVARREPARVIVRLEAIETIGDIMDGVQYQFWTFNGHVPGPFIRVRVGDTLEVHLKNNAKNKNTHTIDFHAAAGTGGGAAALTTEPGKESVLQFKTLNPGFFVYHCAANPVPVHIANGLYGAILVEPEEGLKAVNREFYVMQSEFYTEAEIGAKGLQGQSSTKALREHPEYIVFNGKVRSLTGEGALKAKVETDSASSSFRPDWYWLGLPSCSPRRPGSSRPRQASSRLLKNGCGRRGSPFAFRDAGSLL